MFRLARCPPGGSPPARASRQGWRILSQGDPRLSRSARRSHPNACVASQLHLVFDRGTIRLDGGHPHLESVPGVLWDDRTGCWRAAAYRHRELARSLDDAEGMVVDGVSRTLRALTGPWEDPPLRGYQAGALGAWEASGRRGVVVLPTGAGKTRVAVAALASCKTGSLVLVPTRALLAQWKRELEHWYGGPVGVIGDGTFRMEGVTVITFESACRHMDRIGSEFELIVVDESHHFASGSRGEALEMSPAPMRLGLTATPPLPGSPEERRLGELIGPVVCEVSVGELVGTYLSTFQIVRLGVNLDPSEREQYEAWCAPFLELRRDYLRAHREASWETCMRALAKSAEGRDAIAARQRAVALASFPQAKRVLTSSLLERHRGTKTLVFTAFAQDAYAVALENLIPVITAETGRSERAEILLRFGDGRFRAMVSARVLNEGIDVPDASVAILVAGTLGSREHVQRIGRVLRPGPDKRAIIYDLFTHQTLDDWRARARRRCFAA